MHIICFAVMIALLWMSFLFEKVKRPFSIESEGISLPLQTEAGIIGLRPSVNVNCQQERREGKAPAGGCYFCDTLCQHLTLCDQRIRIHSLAIL